ncbi:MAG: alpha-L-rhamnosidase N-terminal domain-containing protein, partial [Prevotella sp.]|nr:alpha-L-rhamnosidase N-terminal domain-containing protein [Prevotella sp.]
MRRLFFILFSFVTLSSWAGLMPTDLRCEHMVSPSCVDNTNPLLSWINVCVGKEGKMQEQKAFQIQVASSKELLRKGKADLWDTGRKNGDEPFCIYTGKALPYGQTCYWHVRVWDARGKKSGWIESSWHMGLTESDWKAKWISASDESAGSPLIRKRIAVEKPVREAWAYVSGLGYSEFYVNGLKCGDDVLSPAQTDYTSRKDIERTRVAIDNEFTGFRVFYVAHDITSLLRTGNNMLGCWLGRGFYGAHNGFTLPYGNPVLKAQVVVRYADGTEDIFATDATWKW